MINRDWLKKNGVLYPKNKEIRKAFKNVFNQSLPVSYDGFFEILEKMKLSQSIKELYPHFITPSRLNRNKVDPIFSFSLFDKRIKLPIGIKKGESVGDETVSPWISFFREFLPRSADRKSPDKWAEEGKDNFIDAMGEYFQGYWEMEDYLVQGLYDMSLHDYPDYGLYSHFCYSGSNLRLGEEFIQLCLFILRGFKEVAEPDQAISWIREMGYEKCLKAPRPKLFQQFRSMFRKCIKETSVVTDVIPSLSWTDFFINVDCDDCDNDNALFYLNFSRKGLSEMSKILKCQNELSELFATIVYDPCKDLLNLLCFPDDKRNFQIRNKITGQIWDSSGDDLDDSENIFWNFFFSHYYPGIIECKYEFPESLEKEQ